MISVLQFKRMKFYFRNIYICTFHITRKSFITSQLYSMKSSKMTQLKKQLFYPGVSLEIKCFCCKNITYGRPLPNVNKEKSEIIFDMQKIVVVYIIYGVYTN